MYQRSSLRYAHTTGHTSLIFTKEGEYIITCGSDGDIRKWRGIDDDDPTSNCLGEFVMCLAHTGKNLLASTDRNTVQSYTFPDIDSDGTLLRFTAVVTCLRADKDLVAAGSEDTNIKVLRISNDGGVENKELHLAGHTGPVLALDISSTKRLLASAAGDGQLKIWNIDTGAEIKSISGLGRCNSFESAVCFVTPSFEPCKGDLLAYVKDKEVIVLHTTSWEVQFTLIDERCSSEYTCCQFSSDGQLLAAGTSSGAISIFDFGRRKAIKCEAPSSDCQAITCLAWHSSNNSELAYCDATGQLGTLFTASEDERGIGGLLDNAAEEDVGFGNVAFDGDDDVGLGDENGGHADYDDNDEDGFSIEKLKSRIMEKVNGELSMDESSKDSARSGGSVSEAGGGEVVRVKSFKAQAVFQPSATPRNLEHRYLVWNSVGIVTAHADGVDGAIDVEFHDANVHHALHIGNHQNHDIAALSTSVLALSSIGAAKIVCIALVASGNKEWSMLLPDGETTVALAVSSQLMAVVTSLHMLRLFSVLGTQREVMSVPGPVVAMAGHENRLIVCYHSAPPGERQQYLGAMLIDVKGLQLHVQHVPLSLPPGRQLTWLGFSDCGSPIFNDSMGLLQLYNMRSGCWYPICDALRQSASVSNNYFVVGVSERSQIVQAVLCRGSSYPMTNPRPMLQELTMQLPLCDVEAQKAELEESLWRSAIMPEADGADRLLKESAIKLFALACRSEMEARAKELIQMIACPELLQLAVKYATKLGRIHLSDRLVGLMPQLVERQETEQNDSEASHGTLISPGQYVTCGSTQNSFSSMLAPKAMEMTTARRASLKRFSMGSHTPTSLKQHTATSSSTLATNANSVEAVETRESESETPSTAKETIRAQLSCPKQQSTETSTARLPLNTVNPFAVKRKVADAGLSAGGTSLNNKLKMAKK